MHRKVVFGKAFPKAVGWQNRRPGILCFGVSIGLILPSLCSSALNDPTQPSPSWGVTQSLPEKTKESSTVELELQQLVKSGKTWTAVIGGQAVTSGDQLGQHKIISVSKEGARILIGQEERLLKLGDDSISIQSHSQKESSGAAKKERAP